MRSRTTRVVIDPPRSRSWDTLRQDPLPSHPDDRDAIDGSDSVAKPSLEHVRQRGEVTILEARQRLETEHPAERGPEEGLCAAESISRSAPASSKATMST